MHALGVFGDTQLRCPTHGEGCGVHLGPVVVTTGTQVTVVTGDGIVERVPGGPGGLGRGSTVGAKLWTECGRVGEWALRFHKGQTFSDFRWQRSADVALEDAPMPPWPLLWRD